MPKTELTPTEIGILKAAAAPKVAQLKAIEKQSERIAETQRQLDLVTSALPAAEEQHKASLQNVLVGVDALQAANQAADLSKEKLDEVLQVQRVLIDQVRAQQASLAILTQEVG